MLIKVWAEWMAGICRIWCIGFARGLKPLEPLSSSTCGQDFQFVDENVFEMFAILKVVISEY